ncbi:MAG: hypothetical protein D6805_08215 [Planctomycetota bacterium]|nr:MAG: hypothetical protein D6805_08215 [Planctomycetota bacterium]
MKNTFATFFKFYVIRGSFGKAELVVRKKFGLFFALFLCVSSQYSLLSYKSPFLKEKEKVYDRQYQECRFAWI